MSFSVKPVFKGRNVVDYLPGKSALSSSSSSSLSSSSSSSSSVSESILSNLSTNVSNVPPKSSSLLQGFSRNDTGGMRKTMASMVDSL